MPLTTVVLGKTLLVRQPIAQSLSALDFQVIEAAEPGPAAASLELPSLSLIVMDADGMAQEWRALAATMGARRITAALVLVASRFNFDEVHDAMARNVAGVILKPFRREEHTARLVDIALKARQLRARRSAPRFPVPEPARAVLTVLIDGTEQALDVRNMAAGGAQLYQLSSSRAVVPGAGAFLPLAVLTWGEVRAEVDVDVIYRADDVAGIRFARFYEGEHKLMRALEERHGRALGSTGRKRRW